MNINDGIDSQMVLLAQALPIFKYFVHSLR